MIYGLFVLPVVFVSESNIELPISALIFFLMLNEAKKTRVNDIPGNVMLLIQVIQHGFFEVFWNTNYFRFILRDTAILRLEKDAFLRGHPAVLIFSWKDYLTRRSCFIQKNNSATFTMRPVASEKQRHAIVGGKVNQIGFPAKMLHLD